MKSQTGLWSCCCWFIALSGTECCKPLYSVTLKATAFHVIHSPLIVDLLFPVIVSKHNFALILCSFPKSVCSYVCLYAPQVYRKHFNTTHSVQILSSIPMKFQVLLLNFIFLLMSYIIKMLLLSLLLLELYWDYNYIIPSFLFLPSSLPMLSFKFMASVIWPSSYTYIVAYTVWILSTFYWTYSQ